MPMPSLAVVVFVGMSWLQDGSPDHMTVMPVKDMAACHRAEFGFSISEEIKRMVELPWFRRTYGSKCVVILNDSEAIGG